jgi:hypothetical protein
MYRYTPKKRYKKTLSFFEQYVKEKSVILDIGIENPLALKLKALGHDVYNTQGEDLDVDFSAFEILEHLVSPYPLLKAIKAPKLVVSVPLRLWFAAAYRSKSDLRDRHYHEFESWQFDWLLEKAGWRIIASEKWTNPGRFTLGIRPLLRWFTPRYYIVYAERTMDSVT